MADNEFFNNQNVYVETDYDNVIVVDPNKVVDSGGKVSERLVNHEELVMYASLEAKVIPRSKLVVGDNFETAVENIRVGAIDDNKETVINFMKPQSQDTGEGQTQDSYLDTSWTDNLTLGRTRNGDVDSQLLGITNISIKINTSYAALVTIEMEDVQGRVLFEQGENSPYSAFFHLPYPLFTLTVKGYYGKALRYELMLKDFNARFDPSSGNYKITTNFISRTYALLSDISIDSLFALPHMYERTATLGPEKTTTSNESGLQEVRRIKSTRGYDMIKNVYSSYKAKGLIDENFPELTLSQMLMKLENFERYVMEAYGQEDFAILNDIDLYRKTLKEYESKIYGQITDNWETKNIDKNLPFILNIPNSAVVYPLKKELTNQEETALQNISDSISSLDTIIKEYNTKLNDNATFGSDGQAKIHGKKLETTLTSTISINNFLTQITNPDDIDYESTFEVRNGRAGTEQEVEALKVEIETELTINGYQVNAETLEMEDSQLRRTFFIFGDVYGKTKYNTTSFLGKLQRLNDDFETKRSMVEEKMSEALAEKIKSPNVGLGFYPTIKNIIAVISASADAFLRLMDQVHDESWEQRKNPIRRNAILSPEKSQGVETNSGNAPTTNNPQQETAIVYPWPQYFVNSVDEDGNEELKDTYPGDYTVASQLRAFSSTVWPEVRFVEEFMKGATQKESGNIDFDLTNTLKDNPFMGINAIEFPNQNQPYTDLNIVPFIYEIFERTLLSSNYTNLYKSSGYRDEVYSVVSDFEYNNLKESVVNSTELIGLLKNFAFSYENMLRYMKSISNNGQGTNWNLYSRGEFTTPYIKSYLENDYGIYDLSYLEGDSTTVESNVENIDKLEKYLKANYSDEMSFSDGYPFNNLLWIQNNLSEGSQISSVELSNDTSKMFSINSTKKSIASFKSGSDVLADLGSQSSGQSSIGKTYDKKPFTYFEWILNYSNSPTQETSDLDSSINSNGNTNYLTNAQVINYYNLRMQKDLVLTESFIDYGTKYDTTENYISRNQTTSLLNTPYFINSIMKGVENEKNEIENPYTALGYLYLNSLPLSTLKEKFKTNSNTITTELNYIFATLNKYSAIHKLPYPFILKYGSIWHRYKKYQNDNIDILDDVWKDFDYVNAYDPISNNTSKSYSFNDYNGDNTTIKQYEQFTDIIQLNQGDPAFLGGDLNVTINLESTRVQNGFFPKVMNDVYYFFTKKDVFSTYSSSELQSAQTEKGLQIGTTSKTKIKLSKDPETDYQMNTWSQYFNVLGNYDFRENKENKVLIIPSFGEAKFNQTRFECFDAVGNHKQNVTTNPSIYNGGVRSLWSSSNYGYYSNEMIDKPKPNQYIKHINPENKNTQAFNLGNDTSLTYSSIDDIFGVFTKDMLDLFEQHFLNFCQPPNKTQFLVNRGNTTFEEFINSEAVRGQYENGEVPSTELSRWKSVYENQESLYNGPNLYKYDLNIHEVLKSLLMVNAPSEQLNFDNVLKSLTNSQSTQFINYNLDVLTNKDIILKIGNPSKYNNKVYGSLTTLSSQKIEDPYNFGNYIQNSLPTEGGGVSLGSSKASYPSAWKAMYEYVGDFSEEGFKYGDNGSYLTDFFVDMEFEFTESNVQLLSPIIKIYASKKSKDQTMNKDNFINEINEYLGEQENFQKDILNQIFIKLNRDLPSVSITEESLGLSKIDGNIPKLELWKTFQSLNDKWVAGQDFKNRTIFEDFLFLDRANRPVGDKVVVNISELEGFITGRSDKMSVYGLLGLIYQKNNFTFIPTPAYTNFYGRNDRTKKNEPLPQDIPNDLFGTFMEVDTRDSRPRMIGIYVGEPSSNLGTGQNTTFRKGDDAFDITNPSDCPLRENQTNKTNYSDSNRCVGFQVDFGKRNQGVFNSVSIDMNQHKNIGPTFQVLADMGSQASGQQVAQQSQSLYNFYKTRSYTCQVQSMGNAMIQPTMYFNLTNVPLFYGPYLIMNVTHNITNRGFTTNFDGVRIPKFALSPPDKLVASVNRQLLKQWEEKVRQIETNAKTGETENDLALTKMKNISQGPEEKGQEITKYPQKPFTEMVKTPIQAQEVIDYVNSKDFTSDKIKTLIYGISTQNKSIRENCYNNNIMDVRTDILVTNRDQFFDSQVCVQNGEILTTIASFDNIEKSLDFMRATLNPIGPMADAIYDVLQQGTVIDELPKTLTTVYMSNIYSNPTINGSASDIINEVNYQKQTNEKFKTNYEQWLDIFKSVIQRGES
jgi:hypothetical protein